MLACGRDKDSVTLTIEEMKDAIKGINREVDSSATPHKIEELYHAGVAAHKKSPHQQLSSKVSVPLKPTSFLSSIQPMFSFKWENRATFFGCKESVLDKDSFEVLDLFAKMVKLENRKYTKYHSPIYNIIPTIIVDFAFKSCIDSGFHLLARCLRHAFDPRAHPIIRTTS